MEFTKMHGCGNDYIYFDCTRQPMNRDLASQLAVRLSDRTSASAATASFSLRRGRTPILKW